MSMNPFEHETINEIVDASAPKQFSVLNGLMFALLTSTACGTLCAIGLVGIYWIGRGTFNAGVQELKFTFASQSFQPLVGCALIGLCAGWLTGAFRQQLRLANALVFVVAATYPLFLIVVRSDPTAGTYGPRPWWVTWSIAASPLVATCILTFCFYSRHCRRVSLGTTNSSTEADD